MREWSVVSGLIEGDDGLLLVANQRRNGSIDWSPPGGVVDPGEHALGALTREVVEETGLLVAEWEGPVYEILVDFGERGGRMRVVVYRALSWSGEIVVEDPDGIVFEAAFHATRSCHDRIAASPVWVSEALTDWLAERWAEMRRYAYRVVGGSHLGDFVVERV
ncbi:MAG TPA: NUDIX hydrolase [Acidimicrobiales bacterium]|jgi:8-oxo-dGTP diphosphatase|nr:NUDIX hydrolase [Acidimicrobiales bacterium]